MSLHLFKANNLGDVDDIDKARENLGISRDIIDPNNVDIKGGSIAVEHFRLNQSEPFEKGYILTADSNGAARWSVLELSNLHEVTNISSFINNVPYASEEWTSSNFMRNEDNLSGITDRVAALSNLGLNYTFGDSEDTSEGFLQVFNIQMSNLKVNDRIETKEITVNDKLVFNNDFISSNNVLYVDPFTKEFRTFDLGNDFEDLTNDIIDDSTRRPPSMALLNTVYQNLTQDLATVESTLESIVIDNYYLKITNNLSDILNEEEARYNLGFGGITISNNSIQTGSLHLDDEFRLITSSFQDGQFLRCDTTGSGTWQSLPIAGVTQNGLVRLTTDYNYDTASDNTIVTSLKTIKTYNDTFSASTQSKIDLCIKTANLLSEFRDISMNDRSVLLSNLHITESDIFEFPKHLGFFQDDVGYLRADNFLSELTGYGYGIEQTRSNLQLEKVAWTGSYFDLIDTPYLDEFSNVFLQIDKNLSELAESEANRTAARENLGLSDMCTMSRSNVDIYGGVITNLISIKTTELILNDTPIPDTYDNICFLKAVNDTGKATWALLPDATPSQKGVITLKNLFEEHDDKSAYTSTFMHEEISSIRGDIDSILIDTNAIDANINSNVDAIESLSTDLSVAIHRPVTGLTSKVTTLITELDSLESLVDDNHNEFMLNNVNWFNNLSNLSITTNLHIDRVESKLTADINFVYSNILNTDVGLLSQRLDFEIETVNSNLEDEVDILNTRIDTELVTLSNLVDTEAIRLDTRIDNELVTLSNLVDTEAIRLDTRIDTELVTLSNLVDTEAIRLDTRIDDEIVTLSNLVDSKESLINLQINGIEDDIDDIKYSSCNTSLRSLQEELNDHIREYQELYLLVDSGSGSNHLTYKVNLLYDDVYMNDGILDKLGDLNAFSNETSRDLEDARERVLVLETKQGYTSNDIIRIDQAIEDTNDDVTSNLVRIVALETSKDYIEGDIQELRTLINDNDSNIAANHDIIISVNNDLQIHKTHYEYLDEDVNSNTHKITELQDSLWGTSPNNVYGVKGHLSNLQEDFDLHVLTITGHVNRLSTLIDNTDSNLEQTNKDLSSLSNVFENHLIHYGYLEDDVGSNMNRINALENYSVSNIHELDTRLQIVETGSSNEQELLRLKVDHRLPNAIQLLDMNLETLSTAVVNIDMAQITVAGTVDTFSDSMVSFSSNLDTLSEESESLSSSLSIITARLNAIRNPSDASGFLKDNELSVGAVTDDLYRVWLTFGSFSNAIFDSNLTFTNDISSLSNIILNPTDGLSNQVFDLRSDLESISNNLESLSNNFDISYSLTTNMSNVIFDSHAGLSVILNSNVDHTMRIHETDIPSIDTEIGRINGLLGGGGGGSTYLERTLWDEWTGGPSYRSHSHYKYFHDAVMGAGGISQKASHNESEILRVEGKVTSLESDLQDQIDDITEIYTVTGGFNMRLSVGLDRMYIQKDTGGGHWQNLHIFR
jgi:hypothetical protein